LMAQRRMAFAHHRRQGDVLAAFRKESEFGILAD